jgi:hypothetical protein
VKQPAAEQMDFRVASGIEISGFRQPMQAEFGRGRRQKINLLNALSIIPTQLGLFARCQELTELAAKFYAAGYDDNPVVKRLR